MRGNCLFYYVFFPLRFTCHVQVPLEARGVRSPEPEVMAGCEILLWVLEIKFAWEESNFRSSVLAGPIIPVLGKSRKIRSSRSTLSYI